ncbi:N-ethylammeline chlorohydrolase, partial [candidate division WOR-3 bacterium]|nr:N-ethylammeline chlorohydrolase [candidate division WOR-3 bacterium]
MKVLKNATIVTMNTNLDIIKNGYIIINDNGDIEEINEGNYSGENAKDMKGDLLIPGLINGHTHTAMTLLRGYADDLPLIEWLEKHIWPKEGEWMNEK